MRLTRGFTLLEMLVVLILLALAAAVAAPALLETADRRPPGLGALLAGAREAAARRGETIHLRVAATGEWRLEGAASRGEGAIQRGSVEPFEGLPLTLVVSPTGACGFEAGSEAAAASIPLDPMACELLD